MESEIIIDLRVMDFECAPFEITRLLGLQPTVTWSKGEAKSKSGRGTQKFEENGWAWSRKLQSTEGALDFNTLFADLLKEVGPVKDNFKRLPARTCVQLACVAYIRNGTPSFSLEEPIIQLLADINASVDFDLYCLNAIPQVN